MSSWKGGGKPFVAGTSHSSSKFSGIPESLSPKVDQLTDAVADVSLEGGEWEVCTSKAKNRAFGGGAGKPWPSQSSGAKVWGHPAAVQELGGVQISGGLGTVPPGNSWPTLDAGSRRPSGRGNNSRPQSAGRGFVSNSNTPSPRAIPLPLEHGWNWPTRVAASSQSSEDATGQRDTTIHLDDPTPVDDDDGKIENDDDSDDTDDELLTDEYDSDVSEKSHDSRKNSKWFKIFFKNLDKLSLDDMHGPARQWHCPACKGGPGEIDWYRGLQPLMTHAKTKGSKRVKLHRGFAELLDEELRRRGTSVIPAGETFGKWKGLDEMVKDRSIVWPPMVVIMNTRLEQDENDKWLGMGNQELLDSFSSYSAVKARHAYGPQGHRGMSVLIFENSAMGFLEAERLHNHFQEQGTDRDAWDRRPVLFYPGGKRQLYGYMAEKQDLDLFNKHCHGNKAARLKFETRSYQEMVVNQMRQMSEDNQQLIWFKDKVAKEQRRSKALVESFEVVSEKLRKTVEENRIVRQRSKMHHEQNKEEMDFQEQFFKDQLETIHKTRDAKEDEFEKIQQEEREKKKQSNSHVSAKGDRIRREEDFAKFVKSQDKEMEKFVSEREKLVKAYEDNKISMKQRHFKEEVQLEKDFDTALNQLMNKYIPHLSEEEGNSSDQ
ncbi:protein SUPPRESSOR OF GENE SILENCING 3-like [Rhododendron vialii]|uniref:protein SUPPRESSOR OF GENE SILENCING 3-like n=1 Tax=Rhododendron vialii TaxID=182163 RepID=UPI00265E4E6E|nr:protein SUPPRESSOR OF GENE SILENCING 3-like [Rhododendron vialii]XP_058210088.1 protein SUPPRESSOR OF GENE SILENCING 3-like [Rhododendron vialii]